MDVEERGGWPVEGLEETLQVEITHVESGVATILALRAIVGDPGHHTAGLIPAAPGVYRLRCFGAIEGTAVDETFIFRGGGGEFGDVESTAAIQFPERLPEVRELEGAVRGAQAAAASVELAAADADDGVSSVQVLAIFGIVPGALGLASGIGSSAIGRRR